MATHEWIEQIELAKLLDKWTDPATTFWTATDPVCASALAGWMRKRRGVKPGTPDTLIWHCGNTVAIEMKSISGRCNPSQREVRAALLRAGCHWWECKSARAAMFALQQSGLTFRAFHRSDGSVDCWRQPDLEPWEIPRRDPTERRPAHPEVQERRRERFRRWRLAHPRPPQPPRAPVVHAPLPRRERASVPTPPRAERQAPGARPSKALVTLEQRRARRREAMRMYRQREREA
jgi:hypothetical protein